LLESYLFPLLLLTAVLVFYVAVRRSVIGRGMPRAVNIMCPRITADKRLLTHRQNVSLGTADRSRDQRFPFLFSSPLKKIKKESGGLTLINHRPPAINRSFILSCRPLVGGGRQMKERIPSTTWSVGWWKGGTVHGLALEEPPIERRSLGRAPALRSSL